MTYAEAENFLVLTAPTSGLQTFILKYGGDKRAFPLQSAEELVRVK